MRLIDADALMSQAFSTRQGYDAVLVEDIVNAPTVDAEPVKHGKWSEQAIRTTSRGVDEIGYYCLECGYFESYTAKYCAGCGVKMDLKDGESE